MKRSSVTKPELRVAGHWLSSFAPAWGGLTTSTTVHGDDEIAFQIVAPEQWRRTGVLYYGAPVEVYLGPTRVAAGTLTEPDWETGNMVALGAAHDGDDAIGLTSGGEATTVPNTTVDQAIARGVLPWTRSSDFGTDPVGNADDEGGLVKLTSILDAWAQENNTGWYVGPDRRVVEKSPGLATPKWLVLPGSGDLGAAADQRADRVFVRYVADSKGTLATASYPATTPASGIEAAVDATDRGKMTSTRAEAIAEAEWDKLQGESGWTNGLTLTRGQVVTRGGVVADLAHIRGGDTIRLLGVPDPRGPANYIDVVVGDTDYSWVEDRIQVNPVGTAARTEDAVLEQVGELAASAVVAAASKSGTPRWDDLIKTGTATVTITAVNTDAAEAVVFAEDFPADGPVPKVFLALDNFTSASSSVRLSTNGRTRSGFTIHATRSVGTTSIDVLWVATVL